MLSPGFLIQLYGLKVSAAQAWLPYLGAAAKFADVDEDRNRLACFLAQIGHESGRLRYTREIWGPTPQQLKYEFGTKLAKQLGNFQEGDGKRYKGRGLIQTTGRMNYHVTTQKLKKAYEEDASPQTQALDVPDFEATPEFLERPLWAAMSAALFWRLHKLNDYADRHDFVGMTRRINGGINGLTDRQALYSMALGYLTRD
jgi:putative chitinase